MISNRSKISSDELKETGELSCSLCGKSNPNIQFKNGYICSNCLKYVKAMNDKNPFFSRGTTIRQ